MLSARPFARAGAAILGLAAVFTACQERPADAARRRSVPDISGAYFGSFNGENGDFWPADFNITLQNKSRVGGSLQAAGRYRDIYFTGTLKPANGAYALRLSGRGGVGRQSLRITMRATYVPPAIDDAAQVGTISGEYTVGGQMRERGTFNLRGGNRRGD